jgi:DNA polymerase III epsilon subunit-like protein
MFVFVDTETTGNGPDDRLCQIAFKPENGPAVSGLFNPGIPISIVEMGGNGEMGSHQIIPL